MATQDIDIRGTTPADPAEVWRLLGDSRTWPDWTPIESAQVLENDGEVGEIRTFKTGRVTVKEEVVERREPERLSYALRGGLAVKDYRADIDVSPTGTGSEIRWHSTFTAKVPGSGGLYRRALLKATQAFVDGLVDHAGRSR